MLKKYVMLVIVMAIVLLVGLAACGRNAPEESINDTPTPDIRHMQEEMLVEDIQTPPVQDIPTEIDADWIMLFEGEPIYENDLRFVAGLMGLALDSTEAQNLALNQLIVFLAIINGANQHGLGVTGEVREEILLTAHTNVELMGLSGIIPDDRLVDFFAVGTLLSRLLNHYFAGHVIDLAEYQQEIAAFAEANRSLLANIELKYIVNQDFDLMRELRERLASEGTANFDELAREYSVFYTIDGGAVVYPIHTFLQVFDLYDHDTRALFGLQTGEISHVFNIEDFFFVVYVISRTEATDFEIENAFVEHYISVHRAGNIDELVDTLVTNADYTINHAAFDAMR